MTTQFVRLQTQVRAEVADFLTSKGPQRFQALYDHLAGYIPGYQPIHFQAEILGWIMRSQLFIVYNQKSEPFITHVNPSAPRSGLIV